MQTEKEKLAVQIQARDAPTPDPESFELYEDYSQRPIAETIKECKGRFDNSDPSTRSSLTMEVEREVADFRIWLQEDKNIEPSVAHYYSISLKSLLLGLPFGVQVARLFGSLLDNQV